jgi:hypothetical protein
VYPTKGNRLRITRPRGLALALFVTLALVLSPTATGFVRAAPEPRSVLEQIRHYRTATWHWQQVMGRPLTLSSYSERTIRSATYQEWLRDVWKLRARHASREAHRPPHRSAWRCIHFHEGSWRDPNSPYYGGLQMDIGFQRAYGLRLLRMKGTADHWTALEQMWTAERALRAGRGFYPWPVSARRCGLI